MQEGESGLTLKKLGDVRADVEGSVLSAPSLQGGTGDLKLLGRLTLGDALSAQFTVVLKKDLPVRIDSNGGDDLCCVVTCLGVRFILCSQVEFFAFR